MLTTKSFTAENVEDAEEKPSTEFGTGQIYTSSQLRHSAYV